MKRQKNSKRSITYIICYRDPNYVRTESILAALRSIESVELRVIKNRHKSILRYPEVIVRSWISRFRQPTDTYFIGFRGHEIFWFIYPIIATKKIIFDEFICTFDWFTKEKQLFKANSLFGKLLLSFMKVMTARADVVLSDTALHAARIRSVYDLPKEKSQFLYVGTDESVFYARKKTKKANKFSVFFYGNMLPLHGVDVILGAIKRIKEKGLNDIIFILVGGKNNHMMMQKISSYIIDNDLRHTVRHIPWVAYKKLPDYVNNSDVALGGPFGNTPQAQKVITGKTYQFLAMATPVVIGAIKEEVGFKDRHNCLIVSQGSEENLAEAVQWAYKNQSSLTSIGRQGRKLYEEAFSIRQRAKKLKEII